MRDETCICTFLCACTMYKQKIRKATRLDHPLYMYIVLSYFSFVRALLTVSSAVEGSRLAHDQTLIQLPQELLVPVLTEPHHLQNDQQHCIASVSTR